MKHWDALTPHQRNVSLGVLVLAGILAGLTACFLGIASAHGSVAGKELAAMEQEAAEARAILGRGAMIRRELDQSAAELEALITHAPSQSDRYAWAYERLSGYAAQTQITLDTVEEISPSADDKAVAPSSYEILLSTRCGYNRLVEFLWRLEKDNPLLRIKKVVISAVPGLTREPRVQIGIQWIASLEAKRVDL